MKLTVEGIENEKGKYEQYKEVIKKQKERLMKEYTELTSKKYEYNNESNVYKKKKKKAKISQQINNLINQLKNIKLTVFDLELQEKFIKHEITLSSYIENVNKNEVNKKKLKTKTDIDYEKNEMIKSKNAIKYYISIGEKDNEKLWRDIFKNAKKNYEKLTDEKNNNYISLESK